jgi:hypothetical protein
VARAAACRLGPLRLVRIGVTGWEAVVVVLKNRSAISAPVNT